MEADLISVIIPTFSREQPLRNTLNDLLHQDYPSFEILVVDQTPQHDPETQTYLQTLHDQGSIRWLRVLWASLPGARNLGLQYAQGQIILFIDDDVELPVGFLTAHALNYTTRSDIGAVAGRVLDRMKLATQPNLTIEQLPPEALDPAIGWYFIDLVHTTHPQPVLTARGCNMSFRRSLLERYHLRFDERFQGSAVREESDFCLRVRQTGMMIWYDPSAVLVHLGEETGGCHDIQTRSLRYQLTFYHNHFWMGLKNLTPGQFVRFSLRLFDCHVLGHPPCYKDERWIRVLPRLLFYSIGLLNAVFTGVRSLWDDGQRYSRLAQLGATHENFGG